MPTLRAGDSAALQGEMATNGRYHKRVCWHRPSTKRRPPRVLDATRAVLVRGLEQRQGSVWLRIRHAVSVAGYAFERSQHRVRALRSDGAESLLALAVALIYLADVRTGFVGKPRPTGGPWQRYTLHDLAQLAYGGQTAADLRRVRRSLDMMVSLGWAWPTKQVRRYTGEDTWRSEAAVRRINFERLCEMTGTRGLLQADRQHADRTRGDGISSMQAARANRQRDQEPRRREAANHAAASVMRANAPPATGDPPRAGSSLQHITSILDLFKS